MTFAESVKRVNDPSIDAIYPRHVTSSAQSKDATDPEQEGGDDSDDDDERKHHRAAAAPRARPPSTTRSEDAMVFVGSPHLEALLLWDLSLGSGHESHATPADVPSLEVAVGPLGSWYSRWDRIVVVVVAAETASAAVVTRWVLRLLFVGHGCLLVVRRDAADVCDGGGCIARVAGQSLHILGPCSSWLEVLVLARVIVRVCLLVAARHCPSVAVGCVCGYVRWVAVVVVASTTTVPTLVVPCLPRPVILRIHRDRRAC